MTEGTNTGYPATAIQRATYETLSAFPALIALFGGETPNVWDSVKRGADGKPIGGTTYIKIGDDQIVGDEVTDQVDETECFSTIRVVDEPGDGSGKELSKLIVGAIRSALIEPEGFEAFAARVRDHGFICTLGEMRDARHLEPADGLTEIAVLTFRWELDPLPDL